MDFKNQNDSLISLKRLSANEDYYHIVFKRTERIASAVFYILSYVENNSRTQIHHQRLSDKAMALHEAAMSSLNLFEYEAKEQLHSLLHALVALESTLRVATAARVITADLELTLTTEIESLERYLANHYVQGEQGGLRLGGTSRPSESKAKASTPRPRRQRTHIPAGDLSSDAVMVYSELSDRTARIKTVLEAKPEATIKDLSDIITDVSSKTIQRDLNSLIEQGEVIRQGERRWSKYSLAK